MNLSFISPEPGRTAIYFDTIYTKWYGRYEKKARLKGRKEYKEYE